MIEDSIAWAEGTVIAVDQRALPHQWRQLRISTVDELIGAITTLAIRGAPAIGVAGAFGVALAAFADAESVERQAARIVAARPTATNLSWGVQRTLAKLPLGPQAVLDEARRMLAEDGRVNRAAASHAADLVEQLCPGRRLRVLTHCNTGRLATTAFGTAIGALRVLHSREKIDSVLVGETRPLLQGARLTTWELAEAGIPHRLTIDSAAAWAMASGHVDCVLVGADRIAADGSVANKIGTYAVALAAYRHSIPFIVVAPESTRDPSTATGHDIVVEERSADEVTHFNGAVVAPQGTAVFNPAFDVTPPDLVTAIVTENGVIGTVTAHATDVTDGAVQQIIDVAHGLYTRGWMAGTAGNISVRTGATAAITGSGLSKGELSSRDIVTVSVTDSHVVSGTRRPSAETAIHTAIYRATGAGAVVHVHPPHATAQSLCAGERLRFGGYELIKGLGASETIDIPVFRNHTDVSRIGVEIETYLTEHSDAPPVLVIAGHGITAWGNDLARARDRVECLEAMCELVTLTGRRDIGSDLTPEVFA